MSARWLRTVCFGAFAFIPASALACQPPFDETFTQWGSVEWTGTPDGCVLSARLDDNSETFAPRIAVVHYRRPHPTAPLRLQMRVSKPVAGTWGGEFVKLLRGTAAGVPAQGPNRASVFEVDVRGVSGNSLRLIASDGATVRFGSIAGFAFPVMLTVEFRSDAGGGGRADLWLGEDTSGPPEIHLDNLDNARYGGVERVTMGLFDSHQSFPALAAGEPVIFDRLSASDEWLFVDDFDNDAAVPVVPNRPQLGELIGSYSGNTCSGIHSLPVLASGTFSRSAQADVYPFRFDSINQRAIVFSGAQPQGAFLLACDPPASPVGRCQAILSDREAGYIPMARGRDYVVVVVRENTCGPYQFMVTGTLGRQ